MSKPRIVLTLIGGLVLAGLGVGALAHVATRSVQDSATPAASVSFVPDSASLVGFVDVRALVASPLFDLVSERQSGSEEDPFARIREELQIDPRTDLSSATFSSEATRAEGGEAPPPARWGWAVRGSFDGIRLEERIASREGASVEEHEGGKLYRFDGGSGESLALALPEAGVFLFGEPGYVREMLDAGAGSSPAALGALAEWRDTLVPGDTFWLAGEPPEGLGGLAGASPPGVADRLPALASFILSGRLSENVVLVARARSADAAGAQSLADLVRGLLALGRLQNSMGPELREVLDTVRIDQEGDRVAISLEAPYEAVRRLLDQRRAAGVPP